MEFGCDRRAHWMGQHMEWTNGLEGRLLRMEKVIGIPLDWGRKTIWELKNKRPLSCVGSGDLYYVANQTWQQLGDIVQKVWLYMPQKDSDLNTNEVAVPYTMMALKLAFSQQAEGAPGVRTPQPSQVLWGENLRNASGSVRTSKLEDISICWKSAGLGLNLEDRFFGNGNETNEKCCWGGCCDTVNKHEILRTSVCGHKIDLSDDFMKKTLLEAWTY